MRSHYTGFLSLRRWLTPHVWKQAHQHRRPRFSSPRWNLHQLIMVAVLMTWTTGSSEAERFYTSRAFYVARHQRDKRPGNSFAGFQKAFAKLPMVVLHVLFVAVRRQIASTYQRFWSSGGFVIVAVDGTQQECPRTAELEKRLGRSGKKGSAPTLLITSLVLLPLGMLWAWRVGPGTASEHSQLRQMLTMLPKAALLVADAGYLGYDLFTDILATGADFLVRLSSRAYLYTEEHTPLDQYRQGIVYYWPVAAQQAGRPPLRVRLICIRGKKGGDVWLLTSVLESTRFSRQQAAETYRWRWQIEGVYRTYKRTLPKLKLWSRTEALVYREAEVSLLALQLLLAQGIGHRRSREAAVLVLGSPRQVLLRLRGEITSTIGARLGPRQLRWYRARLEHVHRGGTARKTRRKWPRRKDHKPPKPPKLRVMPEALKAKMKKDFSGK